MDKKLTLIPFARYVVEKAFAQAGITDDEKKVAGKIKDNIDKIILSPDEDTEQELLTIISNLQPEPPWAVGIRALIRPAMTLILTVVFVVLTLGQVGILFQCATANHEVFKEVFTVFLAVYGPIIGFWFGERKAEKK